MQNREAQDEPTGFEKAQRVFAFWYPGVFRTKQQHKKVCSTTDIDLATGKFCNQLVYFAFTSCICDLIVFWTGKTYFVYMISKFYILWYQINALWIWAHQCLFCIHDRDRSRFDAFTNRSTFRYTASRKESAGIFLIHLATLIYYFFSTFIVTELLFGVGPYD